MGVVASHERVATSLTRGQDVSIGDSSTLCIKCSGGRFRIVRGNKNRLKNFKFVLMFRHNVPMGCLMVRWNMQCPDICNFLHN